MLPIHVIQVNINCTTEHLADHLVVMTSFLLNCYQRPMGTYPAVWNGREHSMAMKFGQFRHRKYQMGQQRDLALLAIAAHMYVEQSVESTPSWHQWVFVVAPRQQFDLPYSRECQTGKTSGNRL